MTREETQQLKHQVDLNPYQSRLENLAQFSGGEYRASCPWHPDAANPSLAVYKGDDGTWQFKCMSRDCAHGDVIAFVMKMDKLTFAEALRKLTNDAGIAEPAAVSPSMQQMSKISKEQQEAAQAYLLEHGVSLDVAKRAKMDAVIHPRLGLAIAMPYGDTGVIKYRCVGKPKDKTSKFSHASGHPSEDLLYNVEQAEKEIDNAWGGAIVYVVESERDCLTMASQGFTAVSVSSASTCVDHNGHLKIDEEQLKVIARADEIFLALDQDPAGQKCADAFEINTSFPSNKVMRITWPYGGKRSDDPKDIGDLYKSDPEGFKNRIEALTQEARVRPPKWRQQFGTIAELDTRPIIQLIEGFMTEGNISIGGLSGSGKTFLTLSITKALTTGKPFVGRFRVPEKVPVLYLIPEVGDRQFYRRAKVFGIPDDESLFLCRTLSKGATLPLDHPDVLTAVRQLHGPVVILDTAIRFSTSEDENSSAQNQWMEKAIRGLREAGCIAVIALHHSPKGSDRETPTLENTLRGSGDIGALMDIVYSIRTDRRVRETDEGEQITVECVKPRDFDPPLPFNLGLKYRKDGETTLRSYIDETGDLVSMAIGRPKTIPIDSFEARSRAREKANEENEQAFLRLVTEEPTLSKRQLQAAMKVGHTAVTKTAERLGYAQEKVGGFDRWTPPPARKPRQDVRSNDAGVSEEAGAF